MAAIVAGIAMAIAISRMDAGIYQYMQTINALVAPPFAAILWVGLLWKRTNGAGAIAAIIAGFASRHRPEADRHRSGSCRGWFYPFGNQAPVCLLVSILACIARHPDPSGPHPGYPGEPRDLLEFRAKPWRAGLGDKWYNSVVLWAGLSLVLTLAAMLVFSQIFFPHGSGPMNKKNLC